MSRTLLKSALQPVAGARHRSVAPPLQLKDILHEEVTRLGGPRCAHDGCNQKLERRAAATSRSVYWAEWKGSPGKGELEIEPGLRKIKSYRHLLQVRQALQQDLNIHAAVAA